MMHLTAGLENGRAPAFFSGTTSQARRTASWGGHGPGRTRRAGERARMVRVEDPDRPAPGRVHRSRDGRHSDPPPNLGANDVEPSASSCGCSVGPMDLFGTCCRRSAVGEARGEFISRRGRRTAVEGVAVRGDAGAQDARRDAGVGQLFSSGKCLQLGTLIDSTMKGSLTQ